MKTIIKEIMMLVLAVVAVSCIKNDVPIGGANGQGKLVISGMEINEDLREKTHGGTRAVAPDDFNVRISCTDDNVEHHNCCYQDLTFPMELPVGKYLIAVQSHDCVDADWDNVHYSVSQNFEIKRDETTTIGALVAKVSNILVSVSFSDNMKEIMENDAEVNVKIGNCGPLKFKLNEQRRGTFKAETEANRLVWDFKGTLDGELHYDSSFIEDVKAGEHRMLNFDVKKVPDPTTGDVKFVFEVSVEVTTYDINLNMDITEDIIEPFEPAIEITSAYSLTEINTIKASDMPVNDLSLAVAAEEGIASVTVEITTDNTALAEAMAAQGITGGFNLATVEDPLKTVLETMGFPTGAAVSGKTALDLNLSGILPMVFEAGGANQFDIQIGVRDAENNVESTTLRLKLVDDSTPPDYTLSIVGDGFDIGQRIIIAYEDSDSTPVKVNITASKGLSELIVDISTGSPIFEGVLKQMGLLGGFDLVDPGLLGEGLSSLGLPCGEEVKDKTYLEFDITTFVPMITMFVDQEEDDVVADFGITIKDNEGNTTKQTIMLKILKAE